MKKIRLILGLLLAATALVAFSSCEDLLNGLKEDETEKEETESSDKIIYNFKLTDDKNTFVYFTSEEIFSYTSPTDGTEYTSCIYQISFTRKSKTSGKWNLYTRPVASIKTIEIIASGTYEDCDPAAEGAMKLLGDDGTEVQTLTITKSDDAYTFTADVTKVNSAIDAKGEK